MELHDIRQVVLTNIELGHFPQTIPTTSEVWQERGGWIGGMSQK